MRKPLSGKQRAAARSSVAENRRPLAGVRVIEAGIALAGPFCGSLLADFGAEVIKVERPDGGDPARLLGPRAGDVPLWWGVAARDKRCVSLDLKNDTDRRRFLELVAGADILVENYRPGVLERLGLGWDVLSATHPGLISMSISGFGHTGPDAKRPGFGKIAEGLSGIVPLTGHPRETPLHVGFSLADTSAGLMGCMAVNMALVARDRNGGRGTRIDVGLYEPLFRMAELQLALLQTTGVAPSRSGSNDPYGWGAPPDGSGRRFVAVRAADRTEWLVRVDAAAIPVLAALSGRRLAEADPADADNRLREWCGGLAGDALGDCLRGAGIAVAPILDGLGIAHSPYLRARGDVVDTTDPVAGRLSVPSQVPHREPRGGLCAFDAVPLGRDNRTVFD